MGRLSTQKDHSAAKTPTHTCNTAGHIASMTDQNGQVTTYFHTDTGRLASITAQGSLVWNFAYNSIGQ